MFGSISYLLLKLANIARNPVPKAGSKALLLDDDGDLALKNSAGVVTKVGGGVTLEELGDAATKDVGTTAGTVAAGDHDHDAAYAAIGHDHDEDYAPISASVPDIVAMIYGFDETVDPSTLSADIVAGEQSLGQPLFFVQGDTSTYYGAALTNPGNVSFMTISDSNPGTPAERYVNLLGLSNMLTLDISGIGATELVNVDSATSMTAFTASSNLFATLDLSGALATTAVTIDNLSNLVDLSLPPNVESLYCKSSGLSGLGLSSYSSLAQVDVSGSTTLGYLGIPADGGAVELLDASDCALSEQVVDAILVALAAGNKATGIVDLSGGTNAIPSAAGLAAKTALTTNGRTWTVVVNEA